MSGQDIDPEKVQDANIVTEEEPEVEAPIETVSDADSDSRSQGEVEPSSDSKPKKRTHVRAEKYDALDRKYKYLQQQQLQRQRQAPIQAAPTAKPAGEEFTFTKPRPQKSDFYESDDPHEALIDARDDWQVERTAAFVRHEINVEGAKKDSEALRIRDQEQIDARYNSGIRKYATSFAEDYTFVGNAVSQPMVETMNRLNHDSFADVTHYLAENPEEIDRISKLDDLEQSAEIVVIKNRLQSDSVDNGNGHVTQPDRPPQPKTTRMPPPPAKHRVGGGEKPSTNPNNETTADFMVRRREEDRRRRTGY